MVPYYLPQYPQPQQGPAGSQASTTQGQQVRAYALDAEQAPDRSVIRGTVLIYGSVARTLIDTGASHSFISYALARSMSLMISTMLTPLLVTTPVRGNVMLDHVCKDCFVAIAGY